MRFAGDAAVTRCGGKASNGPSTLYGRWHWHRHLRRRGDNVCSDLCTLLLVICLGVVMAGCTPEPPTAGSCGLALPQGSDEAAAIRAVIETEGRLVVAQEIDALMALWSETGTVSDAKQTPEQQEDDQFWRGADAVRHRYVRTVFPGAPSAVTPADLDIQFNGDRAEVTATTRIGDEVAQSGDRWVLVKERGCWVIESLTYNLEPAQP